MLTKRQAIRECKKLWREIKKSGCKTKNDFLKTLVGKKWLVKNYIFNCPLCEYSTRCTLDCPLFVQYNKTCSDLWWDNPSKEWYDAVFGLKE